MKLSELTRLSEDDVFTMLQRDLITIQEEIILTNIHYPWLPREFNNGGQFIDCYNVVRGANISSIDHFYSEFLQELLIYVIGRYIPMTEEQESQIFDSIRKDPLKVSKIIDRDISSLI